MRPTRTLLPRALAVYATTKVLSVLRVSFEPTTPSALPRAVANWKNGLWSLLLIYRHTHTNCSYLFLALSSDSLSPITVFLFAALQSSANELLSFA